MRPRVLIVDDDPATLQMVAALLQARLPDLIIETSNSPSAALDLLIRSHYDLLLSDVVMAGLGGVELLGAARRQSPRTMVILYTGGPTDLRAHALGEGAHALLEKPFEIDELVSAVALALQRGNLLRHLDPPGRRDPPDELH